MSLEDINLKQIYDTSTDNLVEDFFLPLLANSKYYLRGVGFFSSGWIRINAQGLAKFAENGGGARWVVSPILSKEDWEAFCLGTQARQDTILYDVLLKSVENLQEELESDEISALAWLIADKIVDFKLAVPGNRLTGEFHDKFGIFTDAEGNSISFSGSYNDSIQDIRNYESIITFKSWETSSQSVVDASITRFERLWSNEDPNVTVYTVPESIVNRIIKLRVSSRPYVRKERLIQIEKGIHPRAPEKLIIRNYQEEAVNAWLANGNRGFFEMATGTGKTITALLAAIKLFDYYGKLALIVTCPYKHLVDQWEEQAIKFGFSPIKAYETYGSWADKLANKILAYNHSDINNLCILTTNTTFTTEKFNSIVRSIEDPVLLVADEAHHFGSNSSLSFLPENITSRLALSATPNRWFDEVGTKGIFSYFGETVFSFPLNKAIEEGFLTQYYYFPIAVELTGEELEEYFSLTQKIIPLFCKKKKTETDEKRLTALLINRSNIAKNAKNKIRALHDLLDDFDSIHHAIFYCSPEQRETVLSILGREKRIRTHQFTYRENNALRKDVLNQFDSGFLQAIVAIKCLDEGVDVPSSELAFFLANSSNPREFVQRRGRVLRKAPGKKSASLYDFLVVPPITEDKQAYDLTRSIFQKELVRFNDFAQSSLNYHSAYDVIWDIAKKFNLLAL